MKKRKIKKGILIIEKIKIFISSFPSVQQLMLNRPLQGGRNQMGKYVFRVRGGGVSKNYRIIDFLKLLWEIPACILRNEYDPFRTSFITLICYCNGMLAYSLTVQSTLIKQKIYVTNYYRKFTYGNSFLLRSVPEGMFLNCVEDIPKSGGKLGRAAGVTVILLKKFSFNRILVRLPSKEEIFLKDDCVCTLGRISNPNHRFLKLYKAGQNRLLNNKPVVRGVAKNPVDHPHGGAGGRCQVTAWSKVAKTRKTRREKFFNKNVIVFSRKKKKKKIRKYKRK